VSDRSLLVYVDDRLAIVSGVLLLLIDVERSESERRRD